MYSDPSLTSCDVNSRDIRSIFDVSGGHYTSVVAEKCFGKYYTEFLRTLTGKQDRYGFSLLTCKISMYF